MNGIDECYLPDLERAIGGFSGGLQDGARRLGGMIAYLVSQ